MRKNSTELEFGDYIEDSNLNVTDSGADFVRSSAGLRDNGRADSVRSC